MVRTVVSRTQFTTEAVVVFAERLRFAFLLRLMARDPAALAPLDLTTMEAREAWPGSVAVAKHARTLRLTGWMDAGGIVRPE